MCWGSSGEARKKFCKPALSWLKPWVGNHTISINKRDAEMKEHYCWEDDRKREVFTLPCFSMSGLDGPREPGWKAVKKSKRSSIIHTMPMRQPAEVVLSKISSIIS